jgi:methylglutaconyl-CoA hydratase
MTFGCHEDIMKTLNITHHAGITTITLNRPDVHNAFNEDLMQDLYGAFTSFDVDDSIRAIVLTGAGRSFCAGGDLNYMKSAAAKTVQQNIDESLTMATMFKAIDQISKPVIGLVNGAAFGGGVGLVAACDIALAHETAIFSLSEVKLGLAPSVISPFVVSKIGQTHARRYFLTGERFDARTACHLGLVSEVYTDETRESFLGSLIKNISANGPHAMAAVKALLRANRELSGQELTQFTAEQIASLRAGAEAQEGMRAFFEKRPAVYVV